MGVKVEKRVCFGSRPW